MKLFICFLMILVDSQTFIMKDDESCEFIPINGLLKITTLIRHCVMCEVL